DATPDDVAKAYMLGWKLGCKGLTVYVTGSREKVVLETHATAKAKQGDEQALIVAKPAPVIENSEPPPRPLDGHTYRIGTPLGTPYLTINENGQGRGQPFELFMQTSKAGSET